MRRRKLPANYTVNKTEKFIEKTHEIKKEFPRIPELIKGIEWVLQREPHRFTNTITNYYLWVTDELAGEDFPTLKIFYMINEEDYVVLLIDIEEN